MVSTVKHSKQTLHRIGGQDLTTKNRDVEDPEKRARDDLEVYKVEVADKETLFQIAVVETARRSVENNQVWLELERARMEREDLHGQIIRAK